MIVNKRKRIVEVGLYFPFKGALGDIPTMAEKSEYYRKMADLWEEEYEPYKNLSDSEEFYREIGFSGGLRGIITPLLSRFEDEFNRKPILDFGCHEGMMLEHFSQLSVQKYGVDINKSSIERAKERYSHYHFTSYDGTFPLPFSTKMFGTIFTAGVLKHIRYRDREELYGEFSRLGDYLFVLEEISEERREERVGRFTLFHGNFLEELNSLFTPLFTETIQTKGWGNHLVALYATSCPLCGEYENDKKSDGKGR